MNYLTVAGSHGDVHVREPVNSLASSLCRDSLQTVIAGLREKAQVLESK